MVCNSLLRALSPVSSLTETPDRTRIGGGGFGSEENDMNGSPVSGAFGWLPAGYVYEAVPRTIWGTLRKVECLQKK